MPFHLVRSRRFKNLYEHVLFNYEWLHAKLSSCPLQAVLADFEDASINTDDKDSKRELMLVADALRLGGAILAVYPNMLAAQLIGRVIIIFELSFCFSFSLACNLSDFNFVFHSFYRKLVEIQIF